MFGQRIIEGMARKGVAHLAKSVFGSDFKRGSDMAMEGHLVRRFATQTLHFLTLQIGRLKRE